MKALLNTASLMQQAAWRIIKETKVIEIWESIGATINLVGSLKMGLLMNHRDIDFHIYTDPFSLADSFTAMARLAENSRIKSINYVNLLEAEDRCIEWHAFYEDGEGLIWQMDLIHILKDSPFDGYFEETAERIIKALTPETRDAILQIKNDIPEERKVMGIRIYQAVLEGGVRDVKSFRDWAEKNPTPGIVTWRP